MRCMTHHSTGVLTVPALTVSLIAAQGSPLHADDACVAWVKQKLQLVRYSMRQQSCMLRRTYFNLLFAYASVLAPSLLFIYP